MTRSFLLGQALSMGIQASGNLRSLIGEQKHSQERHDLATDNTS
jgi:hypothetical protein